MATEGNREIVARYREAFNRGDMDAAAACFAEDACNFGHPVGRAGICRVLKDIQTTFPDIKLEALHVVAESDWVVERGTFSGTHRGVGRLPVNGGLLVGVPATNRFFQVHHIHMYRLRNGEIADHYANRDDIGMMRQLGLPPSVPGRQDVSSKHDK